MSYAGLVTGSETELLGSFVTAMPHQLVRVLATYFMVASLPAHLTLPVAPETRCGRG